MTLGLRCSQPARRPHPASLPVRVPTVEGLSSAAFGFASRLHLAVNYGYRHQFRQAPFILIESAHAGHTGAAPPSRAPAPWPALPDHFSGQGARPGPTPRLRTELLPNGTRKDIIWIMAIIQITSAKRPFTDPRVAHQAVTALGRAQAMGLLPEGELIESLDLSAFRKVVKHLHRAGIARSIYLAPAGEGVDQSATLERRLEQLNTALEDSPAPEYEWNRLTDVLGLDQLARLVGISLTSVRRYRAAARSTPDEVAGRLHFLSLIVGDLSGAYNDIGIRQWFDRKRVQLRGRAPAELLRGAWKPGDSGPSRVRELGRSLAASPAT